MSAPLFRLSPERRRVVAREYVGDRVSVVFSPGRRNGDQHERAWTGTVVAVAAVLGGTVSDVLVLELPAGTSVLGDGTRAVAMPLATVRSITRLGIGSVLAGGAR